VTLSLAVFEAAIRVKSTQYKVKQYTRRDSHWQHPQARNTE